MLSRVISCHVISLQAMLRDVRECAMAGVSGVVIGALTADGEVDVEKVQSDAPSAASAGSNARSLSTARI